MDTCTEQKNSGGLKYLHVTTRVFYFYFYLKIIFTFVRDFNVKHRGKRAVGLKGFVGNNFQ